VQDQNLLPVPGAQVTLVIDLPSAERRVIIPELTDGSGIARYTFNYTNEPTGVVQVIVSASFETFQTRSITSFRIWY
jgi:hypothetical protein